jgi:DNA-binding MarR family transcriptional regulator
MDLMQSEDDFDLTRFLPYLIGRIGRYLNVVIGVELEAQGVTIPMWRVIGTLWRHKTCSMGELSDAAAVAITALSRLVGKMEREGIVERKRSPKDARVVMVTLTPRGRSIAKRLIPPSLAMEKRVLAKLSAADVRALRATLTTVYQAITEEIKATD